MKHITTRKIKTERLLLRAIREKDYKDIFKYASKEEVARYVSWDVHKSIADTKAVCKKWADEYKNSDKYHWALVIDGKVIGNIEIVKMVGTTAYIGWQIDSKYWNKGIMTEAATAVRDYMFASAGIEALEASYISENIGSGRVMQKIGMTEIPVRQSLYFQVRHETEIDGMPLVSYRLTAEEWERMK